LYAQSSRARALPPRSRRGLTRLPLLNQNDRTHSNGVSTRPVLPPLCAGGAGLGNLTDRAADALCTQIVSQFVVVVLGNPMIQALNFSHAANQAQTQVFVAQLHFFENLYTSAGVYGDASNVDLLARGAVYGQMLGVEHEINPAVVIGVSIPTPQV
jgi:hypothetical protein